MFGGRNENLQPSCDGVQFGVYSVPSLTRSLRRRQEPGLHGALEEPGQGPVPAGQAVQLDELRSRLASQPLNTEEQIISWSAHTSLVLLMRPSERFTRETLDLSEPSYKKVLPKMDTLLKEHIWRELNFF